MTSKTTPRPGEASHRSWSCLTAVVFALLTVSAAQGSIAEVRTIALAVPSGSDVAASLPSSQSGFSLGSTFYVEIWAQTSHGNGLSSVSLDLTYQANLVSALTISHTNLFSGLAHGVIDQGTGIIDDLSGSHLGPCTDGIGVNPNWARVAIVEMMADASGLLSLQAGPTGTPAYGTAICGVGDVDPAQILFPQTTLAIGDTSIPTLSEWGVAVLALVLVAAASVILVRRSSVRPGMIRPGPR